jgi:hypothetical protein
MIAALGQHGFGQEALNLFEVSNNTNIHSFIH